MKKWIGALIIGLLLGSVLQAPVSGQPFSAQIIRALQTYGIIANGCTDGQILEWDVPTGKYVCTASAPGSAPAGATYLTQTTNATLTAEQALSALSSGIMRVAVTTGVVTSLTDSAGIAANLSDETGSGALVFATTPTLVTPEIGAATGTSLVLTGSLTSGADQIATAGTGVLRRNTSDGGDTGVYFMTGGGGTTTARGGSISASGNENANPGYVILQVGNVAGSLLEIRDAASVAAFTVAGADATVTIANDLIITGIQAGAAGDTDACLDATTNELTDAGANTCIVSSLRFKDWLGPLTGALEKVLRLDPGVYRYKAGMFPPVVSAREHVGFYAENMAAVEPRLTWYEQDGTTPLTINFEETTALLAGAIQELKREMDVLRVRITVLEAR